MIDRIIGGIATLALLYFLFDSFFWNGGIVSPSILARIGDSMGMLAISLI